jgi:hypothetical protein
MSTDRDQSRRRLPVGPGPGVVAVALALAAVTTVTGCGPDSAISTDTLLTKGVVDGHEWSALASHYPDGQECIKIHNEGAELRRRCQGEAFWWGDHVEVDAEQVPGTRRWIVFGVVPRTATRAEIEVDAQSGRRLTVSTTAPAGLHARFFATLLPAGDDALDAHAKPAGGTTKLGALLFDARGSPVHHR